MLEAAESPYVNLPAVREQDKDKSWVANLINARPLRRDSQIIHTEFKGAVLAGFPARGLAQR